jgi:hypothetical protein
MRGPVVPTDLGAEKMLGYMVIIATINSKWALGSKRRRCHF